jgi:hypothetical protein
MLNLIAEFGVKSNGRKDRFGSVSKASGFSGSLEMDY